MPSPTSGGDKSAPSIDPAAAKKIAEALKALRASANKIKVATEGTDKIASELDKVK